MSSLGTFLKVPRDFDPINLNHFNGFSKVPRDYPTSHTRDFLPHFVVLFSKRTLHQPRSMHPLVLQKW